MHKKNALILKSEILLKYSKIFKVFEEPTTSTIISKQTMTPLKLLVQTSNHIRTYSNHYCQLDKRRWPSPSLPLVLHPQTQTSHQEELPPLPSKMKHGSTNIWCAQVIFGPNWHLRSPKLGTKNGATHLHTG